MFFTTFALHYFRSKNVLFILKKCTFRFADYTKGLSASQVAHRYEISRQTAHYFMQKVREAMKSSESQKMNDSV